MPENDINFSNVTPPDQTGAPPGEDSGDHLGAIPGAPEADDTLRDRVDRLGMGEPAPDISAEEFARLQQTGNIHLDPQGRVRATRHEESDPGISLRKRRAWYGAAAGIAR